jgi:hypothetical protein
MPQPNPVLTIHITHQTHAKKEKKKENTQERKKKKSAG